MPTMAITLPSKRLTTASGILFDVRVHQTWRKGGGSGGGGGVEGERESQKLEVCAAGPVCCADGRMCHMSVMLINWDVVAPTPTHLGVVGREWAVVDLEILHAARVVAVVGAEVARGVGRFGKAVPGRSMDAVNATIALERGRERERERDREKGDDEDSSSFCSSLSRGGSAPGPGARGGLSAAPRAGAKRKAFAVLQGAWGFLSP